MKEFNIENEQTSDRLLVFFDASLYAQPPLYMHNRLFMLGADLFFCFEVLYGCIGVAPFTHCI